MAGMLDVFATTPSGSTALALSILLNPFMTPQYRDTAIPGLRLGSVGMTFEMASARGLAGERRNGEIVTYADGVQRHFVASIGTIETASVWETSCGISLSIDAVRIRRAWGAREYLIPLTGDRSAVHKLAVNYCGTASKSGGRRRLLSL